jgi:hypothetical protein
MGDWVLFTLDAIQQTYVVVGAGAVSVGSLVIALVSAKRAGGWKRRYLSAFDNAGHTVEEVVLAARSGAESALRQGEDLASRITVLEQKQHHNFDKLGLVRFNPFEDTGADLSFSLSVLNDRGDGVVLTSLWGREEVRVYAKPLQQHESRYALSQEEKQAIDLAANSRQGSGVEARSQRKRNK